MDMNRTGPRTLEHAALHLLDDPVRNIVADSSERCILAVLYLRRNG